MVLLCVSLVALGASLKVEPVQLKPGSPVVVYVEGLMRPPSGKIGDRPLTFYPVKDGFEALSGLPVEAEAGELWVEVNTDETSNNVLREKLTVGEPEFPARELTVAKDFVEPPRAVRQRIKADQKAFKTAYAQPFAPRQFSGPFKRPRDSEVTAPFGDLRTFNGKKQSQHYGMDLDGKVGEPIRSAHNGKVVLVRDCYSSGNTILVSHGGGLFTAYFHMSSFQVRPGDRVKQGQLLGAVGKTGRVTGPHLHWAVKVDGLYVNPQGLLDLPFNVPLRRP